MKPLIAALLLALVAAPVMAGDAVDTTFVKTQGPHPFNVRDLVMMHRMAAMLRLACAAPTMPRTRASMRCMCSTCRARAVSR